MTPLRCSFAVAALALVVVAGPAAAEAPANAAPLPASFEGVWQTTYGEMVLSQEGTFVRGTYSYLGTSTLQGSVEGRRLTFRYRERNAAGEGWFELDASGGAFAGTWREDGGATWSAWTGERAQPADPQPAFAGLFETPNGRIRMYGAADRSIAGTYLYDGREGTLKGTARQAKLTFRWREGGSEGDGWFETTDGGATLRGAWRSGSKGEWRPWNGQRVEPEAGVRWLVVLEAYWERSLEEEEYSFGALLRSYFGRFPRVRMRHRRFADPLDFARAARQTAFLAEPVVVVVASHGEEGVLVAGGEQITGRAIGEALRDAPNVRLVHFSSCQMMAGGAPAAIREALGSGRRVALSGYETSVDWSASAILELAYLDLVLGRDQSPQAAAAEVARWLRFAGEGAAAPEDSPFGVARLRVVE